MIGKICAGYFNLVFDVFFGNREVLNAGPHVSQQPLQPPPPRGEVNGSTHHLLPLRVELTNDGKHLVECQIQFNLLCDYLRRATSFRLEYGKCAVTTLLTPGRRHLYDTPNRPVGQLTPALSSYCSA